MTSTPSDREDVFRFLDLPAELRNRVYDFAATPEKADQHTSVLPSLALAQTNRQLRAEYLPICKTAPVVIEWDDLPAYFAAFYPTPESMKQAPSSITILVDCHADQLDATIDILPLLKLHHANPTLTCTFTRHPCAFTRPYNNPVPLFTRAQHDTHEAFFLRGEATGLSQLLSHCTPEWLEDVANGTVVSVMLSAMGKRCFNRPAALTLWVDHEDAKSERIEYGDKGWLWRRAGLRHTLDGRGYNLGIGLRYKEKE